MPSIQRTSLIFMVLLFYSSSPCTLAQNSVAVVSGSRPVAQAIERVAAMYRLPVTYEDPEYVHKSEVMDVTEEVSRDWQSVDRILVPKSETLQFRYVLAAQHLTEAERMSAAIDALGNVLASYNASRGIDMFSVVNDNGLLGVVPTHYVDIDGRIEQITPLLNTIITIPPKQRTGADLVKDVCETLSQVTGHHVVVGTVPSNLLRQHTTTTAGTSMTARSLLAQLFGELSAQLAWELLYDPSLHWYVLNIYSLPV